MMKCKSKVLVAMSGGVDSSVAALLLKQAGHDLVGCFMRLGSPDQPLETLVEEPSDGVPQPKASGARIGHQGCCSISDALDGRKVADSLGIPFYVLNFKRDFGRVMDYFVQEYNAGRTPNPCIRCNDWLKFGKLMELAQSLGADYVATGHYARIEMAQDGPRLLRGVDLDKDQSYVLFGQPLARLSRMLLPVGLYAKSAIRQMAADHGLEVAQKPDSQEICFVPEGEYADLIQSRTPGAIQPGSIRDTQGRELGSHDGHQHYTIGQRRGLGLATGDPVYVVAKDPATNTVTVASRRELACTYCTADGVNWLVDPPQDPRPCLAQVRAHARPVAATFQATGPAAMTVQFQESQLAVAPGQGVVCYDGSRVLAGGWINKAPLAS